VASLNLRSCHCSQRKRHPRRCPRKSSLSLTTTLSTGMTNTMDKFSCPFASCSQIAYTTCLYIIYTRTGRSDYVKDFPILSDFVDNFPDFPPIPLTYFPIRQFDLVRSQLSHGLYPLYIYNIS